MKLGTKLKKTLRVIGDILIALFNREKAPDNEPDKGKKEIW